MHFTAATALPSLALSIRPLLLIAMIVRSRPAPCLALLAYELYYSLGNYEIREDFAFFLLFFYQYFLLLIKLGFYLLYFYIKLG